MSTNNIANDQVIIQDNSRTMEVLDDLQENKVQAQVKAIDSLVDVDAALHRLSDLFHTISRIEADADAKINAVVDEKVALAKPVNKEIHDLEQKLRLFLFAQKSMLFSKVKTMELNFGKIGFRQSTQVKTKKDTLDLIRKLNFEDGFKAKFSLNRNAMKNWPIEKLAQVHASKIIEDQAFYDVNEFSLKDLD
jgi:phage host-nuclease inhibitor protein Gam